MPVGAGAENLVPTGIHPPDRPARNKSHNFEAVARSLVVSFQRLRYSVDKGIFFTKSGALSTKMASKMS